MTSYNKIYTFPNRFGFLGFTIFLVMLAAGATFQNNLVYMMAFLYLGLGLVAILHSARNIRDLEVSHVAVAAGFPGEEVQLNVTIKNPTTATKFNIQIALMIENESTNLETKVLHGQSMVTLSVNMKLPKRRGVYNIRRLKLESTYPYLMFKAWRYFRTNTMVFVFPQPFGHELEDKMYNQPGEEFSNHKPYEINDRISRVDWRVYSRTGTMYVREFRDGGEQEVELHWRQTKGHDTESRLSQLARWILSAESKSLRYDLNLPGFRSGFGSGNLHATQCLIELAKVKDAV